MVYGGKYEPSISIILPTYNEEDTVWQKLENIQGLDYPREKMELIIVDSSTDRTLEVVRQYVKEHPQISIRVIREPERRGLATALNIGYGAASGDIVVKSDVDSLVLTKDALKRVAMAFFDTRVGGVCGVRVGKRDVEGGLRSLQVTQQMAETTIDSTIVAHGSFASFRKELIVPLSPESFADDTELFVKIRRAGYRTVLDTTIKTYEPYHSNPKVRLKQMSRRAGGIIKVIIENRSVLFNPKYGKYGLLIYPLNVMNLLVLPWVVLAGGLLVSASLLSHIGSLAFILILVLIAGMAMSYCKGRLILLAGALDIFLSSFLGLLKLLTRKKASMWEKVRP